MKLYVHVTENFSEARLNLRRAEETSNLESDDEIEVGVSRKRKIKRPCILGESDSEGNHHYSCSTSALPSVPAYPSLGSFDKSCADNVSVRSTSSCTGSSQHQIYESVIIENSIGEKEISDGERVVVSSTPLEVPGNTIAVCLSGK